MTPLDASLFRPREGGPSFPLRHRLFRLVWGIAWMSLGIWTPVPMHGWRRMLLRAFGARIHPTARIYPGARIWYPPNLSMDRHACLGPRVICYCMDRIEIGAHAVVSQGAHLCGGTHAVDDPHFQLVAKPIVIGRDAWIAAEAFVGPGVAVGEGAVLGARGVAFSNLAPMTVYAGNPARRLRARQFRRALP
ncbi:MAG: putative colanic acid biosynthesis acetyltransferase [Shinella sp.]|jgi:putative colanic acid biosynthesis acetyltransferase WcaF|nr:putative colanic acid biosynthesis acetyltransferase [Shinella sp.]